MGRTNGHFKGATVKTEIRFISKFWKNGTRYVLCLTIYQTFVSNRYSVPVYQSGRQIAAQYQQSQRMVLSPMVLVINTLVAEFLYAQNCHFSLSVFSSEVPYKNVLPDFEKVNKFRFDSVELDEIMKVRSMRML